MVPGKKIILILLLFITSASMWGQEYINLYLQAQSEYKAGNFTEALNTYLKAKNSAEELGDTNSLNYTVIISDIGQCNLELGRYNEAEENLSVALNLREKHFPDEWKYLAASYDIFSSLYSRLGQFDKAEKYSIQAIEIKKLHNARAGEINNSINRLAIIYQSTNRPGKADSLITSLQNNESDTDIKYICNLATSYLKNKNFNLAQKNFYAALNMITNKEKQVNDYVIILNNLGMISRLQKDYVAAESLYIQALNSVQNKFGNRHPLYSKILSSLSLLYYDWGNLEKAEKYFLEQNESSLFLVDRYFPTLNEEEREKFWNVLKQEFDHFNFFCTSRFPVNPYILCEMYNNQIATKALLLYSAENEKKKIQNTRNVKVIQLYADIQKCKQDYSSIYLACREDSCSEVLDSLNDLINLKEHELSVSLGTRYKYLDRESSSWKDIQLSLHPGEAAIEIIRFQYEKTDTIFYAALILTPDTKDHPEIVINENGSTLETSFYANYKNSIIHSFNDDYSYFQFWKNINDRLNGIKKIYLSADGVYNQVNLNTLRDTSGVYLLERYDIISVTNTNELLHKNNSNTEIKKEACLFGNPSYDLTEPENIRIVNKFYNKNIEMKDSLGLMIKTGNGLDELPGTEQEIKEIENVLQNNGWKVKSYIKDEAVEEAVKNINNPGILHIATHGSFSGINFVNQNVNPLLKSVLFFAGANRNNKSKINSAIDNGILTALEAANLKLENTELVILSACETAGGEVKDGEGVYGLQRALRQAGAKTILMTLWKVEDEKTKNFMISFYKKWVLGYNKFEAFKNAQLEMKEKYDSAQYWGAFLMIGI